MKLNFRNYFFRRNAFSVPGVRKEGFSLSTFIFLCSPQQVTDSDYKAGLSVESWTCSLLSQMVRRLHEASGHWQGRSAWFWVSVNGPSWLSCEAISSTLTLLLIRELRVLSWTLVVLTLTSQLVVNPRWRRGMPFFSRSTQKPQCYRKCFHSKHGWHYDSRFRYQVLIMVDWVIWPKLRVKKPIIFS